MRHVDDGTLHAFLDGALPRGEAATVAVEAHLALCADCRNRLERERDLRGRAEEVLAAAAPLTEAAPPFEEILARHGARAAPLPRETGGTARGRRRTRAPLPLAWAASVVLAVGAGWMARAILEGGTPAPSPRMEEAARRTAVDPEPVAAPTVGPPARQAERESEETADAANEAAVPPAAEPTSAPTSAPPTPPRPALADRAGAAAPPPADSGAVAALADMQSKVAGLPMATRSLAAEDMVRLGAALAPELRATAPTTAAAAALRLGVEPASLEGAELMAMALGTAGDTVGVLSAYRLPDGAVVELAEWRRVQPPAAERDRVAEEARRTREQTALDFPTAPASARSLIVERLGTLVRVRAALGEDALAALARRIR